MYVIEARNVNGVYAELLRLIRREGQPTPSRAGPTLALPAPVMLVTHRPLERVLLDPGRDANPFFHLFESLFLLAGRDDYTWLDRFVRDFSARFADPDGRGWGSYGTRWRRFFGVNQLDVVVEKLRADHHDRRVVISMWQPGIGIYNGDRLATVSPGDMQQDRRDVPCNTHIYPRVVDGRLDLTVCCRSNDAVWGAAGANAVQFSMLLEYLAGRIGVQPGRLFQLANNMHAYVARLDRYGEPQHRPYWPDVYDVGGEFPDQEIYTVPVGTDWEHWDEDLRMFMKIVDAEGLPPEGSYTFRNSWFPGVAGAMWAVHHHYASGKKEYALEIAATILAPDWRLACSNWIKRRMK